MKTGKWKMAMKKIHYSVKTIPSYTSNKTSSWDILYQLGQIIFPKNVIKQILLKTSVAWFHMEQKEIVSQITNYKNYTLEVRLG